MKIRSRSSLIPTKRSRTAPTLHRDRRWTCRECLAELRLLGSRKNVEGMARFGIHAKNVYGVSKPKMDRLARRIGKNHSLALQLWNSGVHDARILAGLVDEQHLVVEEQMDRWVGGYDNWDI